MDLSVVMDAESIKHISITPLSLPTRRSVAESRGEINWADVSNKNLKFVFDTFSNQDSPFTLEVLLEIQQRMARGEWLDLEKPPPPSHALPWVLTVFPLRLLWKQRSGGGG